MPQKSTTPENHVFEEIMLREPPPLRIQHARIPIAQIDFDPANPRLRYQRELHPDKDDLALLFETDADTAWLKRDIKDNGVIDPIYVRKIGERYRVIEGNRRTGCVKMLNSEKPDEVRFLTIPARIMPEATTEEQTALLMASFHVAGKVKWQPHEKAGHIYHMLKVLRLPETEMANTLHMAVPTIKRTAESFAILEDCYKRIDGEKYKDTAAGKWSFFAEMLRTKPLRLERERDPAAWDAKFSRWVGEGRIPNALDVRKLPDILKKAKARHLFENEEADVAFAKASKAADETQPANLSKMFKHVQKALDAVGGASLSDLTLAGENEAARVLLIDTYAALGNLMEKAGVRVPGPRRVA